MLNKTYTIVDSEGLHIRPVTKLAKSIKGFESKVTIAANGKSASLKSVLQVMALGVSSGHQIEISADGADEAEVMEALDNLLTAEKLV